MHDRLADVLQMLTIELTQSRAERRRHLVSKEDLMASEVRILAAIVGGVSDGISPVDIALLDGLLAIVSGRTAKLEALDAAVPA